MECVSNKQKGRLQMGMVGGKKKSRTPMPAYHDLTVEEVPESMDPDKVVNLEDIPGLFRSIERLMRGLRDLNAEFCLKGENIGEVWLVPSYTHLKLKRREISFEDASKLVVVCASFGGKVEGIKFLDVEREALEEDPCSEEILPF